MLLHEYVDLGVGPKLVFDLDNKLKIILANLIRFIFLIFKLLCKTRFSKKQMIFLLFNEYSCFYIFGVVYDLHFFHQNFPCFNFKTVELCRQIFSLYKAYVTWKRIVEMLVLYSRSITK